MNKDNINLKMFKFYRNRNIARLILVSSIILLIITFIIEKKYGESLLIEYIEFIIEAILIASIADGVAIHLFTMLIQKKRENLVSGIIIAFKEKFFPKNRLVEELKKINIINVAKKILDSNIVEKNSNIIGKYVSNILEKNKNKITETILNNIIKYIDSLDKKVIVNKITNFIKKSDISYKFMLEIITYADNFIKRDEFKKDIVDKLEQAEERLNFVEKIGYSIAKSSNVLNYKEISEQIELSLENKLNAIKLKITNKDWESLENEISELIINLSNNHDFMVKFSKIKYIIINDMLKEFLLNIISTLSSWIEDGKIEKIEVEQFIAKYDINTDFEFETINVIDFTLNIIRRGLNKISENDKTIQENYNKLVEKLVDDEYDQILLIIEDVLSKLSDKNLIDKVNEVVGSNIQWLRISGAYVGAVVGIIIFTVMKFPTIGLPVMIAMILVSILSKKIRKNLVVYSK